MEFTSGYDLSYFAPIYIYVYISTRVHDAICKTHREFQPSKEPKASRLCIEDFVLVDLRSLLEGTKDGEGEEEFIILV